RLNTGSGLGRNATQDAILLRDVKAGDLTQVFLNLSLIKSHTGASSKYKRRQLRTRLSRTRLGAYCARLTPSQFPRQNSLISSLLSVAFSVSFECPDEFLAGQKSHDLEDCRRLFSGGRHCILFLPICREVTSGERGKSTFQRELNFQISCSPGRHNLHMESRSPGDR